MFNKFINFFKNNEKQLRSNRFIFTTILITSLIGLLASFVLSVEAIELLKNPDTKLGCSINAVIDCAAVGKTSYSSLLGFPNSFIGMMTMPLFAIVSIIGLYKVRLPKQFMFAVQIMAIGALIFAFFLFHISVVLIQVLCPWCLLVDVATIIMFFALTRYNVNENNLYLSKKLSVYAEKFIQKDYDKFLAALLIIVGLAVIIMKFGSSLFA